MLKILIGLIVALAMLFAGYYGYLRFVSNPAVIAELKSADGGARAGRVMLVTLPDGRELPVNYLREGGTVFVGVDGRWWRQTSITTTPIPSITNCTAMIHHRHKNTGLNLI